MKNRYIIIVAFVLFVLFVIFVSTFKFAEGFSSGNTNTVNLPLTTTYSCKNFCGPTARCSITGQQCFADIDCPGCQPYVPPLTPEQSAVIPGDNDAGNMTAGLTPNYSSLTSDIGTRAAIADFGTNVWRSSFNESSSEFNKRYKPEDTTKYPERYTLTGEFVDDGPFPSNS